MGLLETCLLVVLICFGRRCLEKCWCGFATWSTREVSGARVLGRFVWSGVGGHKNNRVPVWETVKGLPRGLLPLRSFGQAFHSSVLSGGGFGKRKAMMEKHALGGKSGIEKEPAKSGLNSRDDEEAIERMDASRDGYHDDGTGGRRQNDEKPKARANSHIRSTSPGPLSHRPSSTSSATNATTPTEAPPDGGRTAWTQVAMLHLTIFSTFGFTTSFGSFQTYYETELNLPSSTISWLGSLQIFLLFFIGTFSGRAVDAGMFRQVYVAGSVLQILGKWV